MLQFVYKSSPSPSNTTLALCCGRSVPGVCLTICIFRFDMNCNAKGIDNLEDTESPLHMVLRLDQALTILRLELLLYP